MNAAAYLLFGFIDAVVGGAVIQVDLTEQGGFDLRQRVPADVAQMQASLGGCAFVVIAAGLDGVGELEMVLGHGISLMQANDWPPCRSRQFTRSNAWRLHTWC
ncbi:hypothetical protein D3C76_1582880 [compost metagenome]